MFINKLFETYKDINIFMIKLTLTNTYIYLYII